MSSSRVSNIKNALYNFRTPPTLDRPVHILCYCSVIVRGRPCRKLAWEQHYCYRLLFTYQLINIPNIVERRLETTQ